ncbi:MAG: class I SAM-dependent methyltransferase [Sciscionella sp.]|nr:class I SAM-dependent methyltransferase [Sciscionella sp.]
MSEIANISDTAHWVAMYRARESSRPDALFHDPFAERLAGERGQATFIAMTASMPATARNGWSFVARTKLIDDLTTDCLADGCDLVLNLAAGLDTRPYRLAIAKDLTWIEADLSAMIEEKQHALASEQPHCELIRRPVDLADADARKQFLAEATAKARRPLVITEGLLPYLTAEQVRAISADLAESGVRWWITDMMSPIDVRMTQRVNRERLASTPIQFGPKEGAEFFAVDGWAAINTPSVLKAASRFNRLPLVLRPISWLLGEKFGSRVLRLIRR